MAVDHVVFAANLAHRIQVRECLHVNVYHVQCPLDGHSQVAEREMYKRYPHLRVQAPTSGEANAGGEEGKEEEAKKAESASLSAL